MNQEKSHLLKEADEIAVQIEQLMKKESELRKLVKGIKISEEKISEELFLEIINNLTIKLDKEKYPNSIFFFKENKFMFEIKNSTIWCSWNEVWKVFEKCFSNNYQSIQSFLEEMFEKHFKMKGVTAFGREDRLPVEFEKHFKIKGVTARGIFE